MRWPLLICETELNRRSSRLQFTVLDRHPMKAVCLVRKVGEK